MKNLYVFNPDTGVPVPADQWLKEEDPTRAQLFGFRSGDGILLMMKNPIARCTFQEAQDKAAAFRYEGCDWKFRCMTRREVIDYQDALDEGLLDVVDAIGGDVDGWIWTSDADSKDGWLSRRSNVNNGWYFYGGYGTLNTISVNNAYRVQAVTLLSTES